MRNSAYSTLQSGTASGLQRPGYWRHHNAGQGAVNSEEYKGETESLTGMINSLIAQNNNQLELVKTTSDSDIAAEASKRDATISAADKALQTELDRLQADVNFANGELVAAQAAEDAQEIIKNAAIADRELKESIFYQTLEEGNNRKSAALAKRVTCVTNAEAAYASETASYSASLKSQNDLLDYELSTRRLLLLLLPSNAPAARMHASTARSIT